MSSHTRPLLRPACAILLATCLSAFSSPSAFATGNSAKARAADAARPVTITPDLVVELKAAERTGRLDATVAPRAWRPGDPIKLVPKRTYDVSPPAAPLNPPSWSVDPLLDRQGMTVTRGPGVFGTPSINVFGALFTGSFPPDTNGDVGPDRYAQAVNASGGTLISAYDKAGGFVFSATLASIGTGVCATGLGDPIVLYDELADRWLLSEFSAVANALCVYVSTSPDVGGSYNGYVFTTPNFPDYPKYAVWNDAYVVTANESGPSSVYVLDRNAMLVGAAATSQRLTVPDLAGFGFQALTPVDFDGAPPLPGEPAYLVRHRDDEVHNPGSNDPVRDFVELYEVSIAFPSGTTITGPFNLPIAEFDSDLCGLSAFNCFPQPSGQQLDPLREVVMWRAQYRNFGPFRSIVGNLVTDVNGLDHGGVRWFELRNFGAGWSLHQEGTLAPDGDNRWMGSVALDVSGNVALGYSVVSPTQPTDIRYSGRLDTDPPGVLPATEYTIGSGSGSQNNERWGDYSSMNVDPVDGCTFWYTNEYVTSPNNWDTRIAAFRFADCGPPPAFCGDGNPDPNEECDDGNMIDGDGCSAMCVIERDLCFFEDFSAAPALPGWSIFDVGPTALAWGATNDGFCFSNNLSGPGIPPAPNVTGGAGEAACVDSDATGGAGLVESYLCTINPITANGNVILEFLYNYQIFATTGEDLLEVLVGTAPPSPATVGSYTSVFTRTTTAGGFAALPGEVAVADLSAFSGSGIHLCFRYRADFDWYAQVDDVLVAADQCGAISDTDGDGVPDNADNCLLVPNPSQLDANGDGFGNACDADLNDDCIVNAIDLGIFKAVFFTADPFADLNGDGIVNALDLGIFKSLFFAPPGPSGVPNICP